MAEITWFRCPVCGVIWSITEKPEPVPHGVEKIAVPKVCALCEKKAN